MVLVLAIGDFHIPHRSPALAQRFRTLLLPGKIQYVLCTGNLCSSEVEDYLRSISPDVQVVAGDMDTALFPGKVVISVGNLSFGLCHGHQLLPSGSKQAIEALRREMGVDVLVTGHTHKLDIWQGRNGGLYINPGSVSGGLIVLKHKVADKNILAAKLAHTTMISTRVQATGAYTTSSVIVHSPSFVLMDVQGSKVVTYSYVLDGDVSEPVFCVEFEPVGAMTTLTSLILLMHSKKKEGVRVDRAAFDKAR